MKSFVIFTLFVVAVSCWQHFSDDLDFGDVAAILIANDSQCWKTMNLMLIQKYFVKIAYNVIKVLACVEKNPITWKIFCQINLLYDFSFVEYVICTEF